MSALNLKCPTCRVRMEEAEGHFSCPRCGHEVTIEKTFYDQVRDVAEQLKTGFGHLPLREVRRKIVDDKDPLTLGIIGLLAYFVARRLPMKIIITIIMTLVAWIGPWGLLLASVIPIVWKLHRSVIKDRAREIRKERGESDLDDEE